MPKVKRQFEKTKLTTVTVSFVVEMGRKLTRKDAKALEERFRRDADDSVSGVLITETRDVLRAQDTTFTLFVHTEPNDSNAPNTLTVGVK